MTRLFLGFCLAFLATLTVAHTAAADSKTIRIEPRPFYGATVSIESGVRVFRPVPPTTHMIINPNRTPVSLSIKEETRIIKKTIRHSGSHDGYEGQRATDGAVGNYGYYGRRAGRRTKPARLGRFPGRLGRH